MKRSPVHPLSTIFMLLILLAAAPAGAVTLTGSTGTALVAEPVSFTSAIRVFSQPGENPPTADLTFNFGDGTASETIAILAIDGGTETHTRTHSFARPGTYTVSATGAGRFGNTVQPPATATFRVTVFSDTLNPGRGKVGEPYSHDLAGTAADRANRHRLRFPQESTFAAGEIIFTVDDSREGRDRIADILDRYALVKVEQTELGAIDSIMVVCRTDGDVFDMLLRLAAEPGLHSVQPNYIFRTLEARDPLQKLQSTDILLDLDALHRVATGKGVVIAVIDTGVDIEHKDLRDRVVGHRNHVRDSPYLGEVHGTAVAGVIAGAENGFGIVGLAPESKILALRACRQLRPESGEGRCYSSALAAAIDTAIEENADVVNLSMGTSQSDDLVGRMIVSGHRRGIPFIAPAGNDSQAGKPAFPASLPEVVSVAGFGEQSVPLPNRLVAMAADAVAPATNIFTTVPDDGHNFFDGTSFAAAMISGLTALYHEKNGSDATDGYPRFDASIPWKSQVARYIGIAE